MSEFFKAELKDKFLEYASERDDYFETQLLYDEFLRPNYSLEFTEKLIKEIIDFDPDLLDIMSGNGVKIFMLSATSMTADFLEEGGFKDMYVKEEEKWDAFLEQLSMGKKLSTEEKVHLGTTEKTTHKKERRLLLLLIFAVAISFIFTLFSLAKEIFFEEKYVTVEDLQQAIKEMNANKETTDSYLKVKTDSAKLSGRENQTTKDSVATEKPFAVGRKP